MPLSQQIQDQIRKDAEKCVHNLYSNSREPDEYDACLHGYIAGATAWAVWKEKAEGYEKALEEIIQIHKSGPASSNIQTWMANSADTALEQFK